MLCGPTQCGPLDCGHCVEKPQCKRFKELEDVMIQRLVHQPFLVLLVGALRLDRAGGRERTAFSRHGGGENRVAITQITCSGRGGWQRESAEQEGAMRCDRSSMLVWTALSRLATTGVQGSKVWERGCRAQKSRTGE